MIVEAETYEAALGKLEAQIRFYRESSDLFEGACKIFCIQLLEFVQFPKVPVMMNYKSFAGDPILPFIGCSVPDGEEKSCTIYNWEEKKLEVDGYSGKLFLEFV